MYLSLYCKGSKRLFEVLWWEGVGNRTELQYIDPHSYGRQRCVFLVLQGCSIRGPGAQLSAECWLLYHILSATSLYPNSSGAPRAPSAWRGLPYHILSITPTLWLLVLTELYNSSTPTQSPTQSLKWHVWSSSSGNNCHAVQRSLSSSTSVYECIMGFFTLSHFVSQFPPMRFLSITGHWDVSLPSGASHWNGIFWPGRRSKYNMYIFFWLTPLHKLAATQSQFLSGVKWVWILLGWLPYQN